MYHPTTKKWIHAPKASAGERVKVWLERLGMDVATHMARIDGFQSFAEFRAWLAVVSEKPPAHGEGAQD